jgi:glycosyltransferase involved in cell wall biosynthesis
VLSLARAYPDAPIYTTLYDPDHTYPEFRDLDVRPSWLNRSATLRRHHRAALPLLPLVSSSIRVDADVVIASSSGWAHGFRTRGRKLVYCYSPARWLYEPARYLGNNPSPTVAAVLKLLSPPLRSWDRRAARSVDTYLAISTVTADRIRRTYGVEAPIVAAPHSMPIGSSAEVAERAQVGLPAGGYFLVVSRLLPYKNVREIVQAFAIRPAYQLVVVGSGPQKPELEREATPNVTFLERLTDEEMRAAYVHADALVAASHEDFGLTPLEAAANGKPSAVLRWGGFLDTVVEGETGVFFNEPTPTAIAEALDSLTSQSWDVDTLHGRAHDFSEEVFIEAIQGFVDGLKGTSARAVSPVENARHG